MRIVLAALVLAHGALPFGVFAAASSESVIEEVRIIGSADAATHIPGSGAVIGQDTLRAEVATDINRIVKTMPGIYVREEEGYGLRPNIGIRGATSERSSKVTLMEDGILVAPAPYSNPAAYYFPTTSRMHAVEVLKGAPLLRHGPQTVGGVINLVSTPIPNEQSARFRAFAGEFGTTDVYANYGDSAGAFGWLVETAQRDTDGFKTIDRTGQDTGYDIEDYVAKFGWQGDRQRFLLKLQYSDETSNSTYLGLTDADFAADPDRRYGLSKIDQMNNDHQGYSLRYGFDVSQALTLTVMGYFNEFQRDWFKLSGGGSLVDAANAGEAQALAILHGEADALGLKYKHNNRAYESKGVEINGEYSVGDHDLNLGLRIHEDEMDRYQPIELYDQVDGDLVFVDELMPTGGDNRFETGEATSLWITDTWQPTTQLSVNLALRYEDVETSRIQYASPDRSTIDVRRSNDAAVWLPGASLTYDINPDWQILAGVHRGFAPLGGGAKSFEEPETSVNYELGARFTRDGWFAELIGFYSDFNNKAENCSNANPCSNGATTGSFTTGEAVISGLEFQLSRTFEAGRFDIPFALTYTWTRAEVSENELALGFRDGDDLAHVPDSTFSLRTGFNTDFGWSNTLVARYTGETCAVGIGCNRTGGEFSRTENVFAVDLVSRYAITPNVDLFVKFENLFDEQAIVSRLPDGALPNKPRSALAGFEINL